MLPLIAATAVVLPQGKVAAATCQAIDATSIASGSVPSGACTAVVEAGNTFEIDFSNIFAANGGSLPLNKFYSLEIANINTGPASTLSFTNVEFLVSGAIGATTFTDQAITIWDTNNGMIMNTPSFPNAQGLSGYSTNVSTNVFMMRPVSTQASFSLSGPNTPGSPNLGTAGFLNTIAVNLQAAGITSFTGAKIRGTFAGSTTAQTAFSAGLALFNADPATNPAPPAAIYGNAFNTVPGPLPLVGAGAAFGWSRRLRRRVASAAGRAC